MVRKVAAEQFSDVIVFAERLYGKLRMHVIDGSYVDVWFSRKIPGRYAYHWERRHIDGSIYRHNNRPHEHLKNMKSFPKHLHNGSEDDVKDSTINDNPVEAVREFLSFIRSRLKTGS